MKLLIIGGYGAFGGRLAGLLSDLPIEIFIGGRSVEKAKRFCRRQTGTATYTPLAFDRIDLAPVFSKHEPDIVVDASGPFQLYGEDPYTVVKACLDAGIHYLDLADAAAFVDGISQFDAVAKDKGVTVLSGLSTCPALSGAVLREFEKDMTVEDISIGIAPTPFAGLGKSVIRAALAYAGGDIALRRHGKAHTAKALTEYRRYTIAPPGEMPLRNRHFSLAELPDFTLFPKNNDDIRTIWGGAGIRPEWLHKGLNILAHIRAWLHLPAFTGLAGLAQWALGAFKNGEHRGGMYVDVTGKKDGEIIQTSWHLIAEGDDGPLIPAKACEAIIRQFHARQVSTPNSAHPVEKRDPSPEPVNPGQFKEMDTGFRRFERNIEDAAAEQNSTCHRPSPGARPASHELTLAEFHTVFERHAITHGFRDSQANAPAFQAVLGKAFNNLPAPVQTLHAGQSGVWTGEAEVKGPANILGHIAGKLAGIKIKSGTQPVTFTLTCDAQTEIWQRDFGGNVFTSELKPGTGRNTHLMMERFGFISVAMALVLKGDKLYFIPRRWFAFSIPLPNLFLPKGESFEMEGNGRFHFNVNIEAPIIGRIASYKGWLERTGIDT